jgi:hypothetical protein
VRAVLVLTAGRGVEAVVQAHWTELRALLDAKWLLPALLGLRPSERLGAALPAGGVGAPAALAPAVGDAPRRLRAALAEVEADAAAAGGSRDDVAHARRQRDAAAAVDAASRAAAAACAEPAAAWRAAAALIASVDADELAACGSTVERLLFEWACCALAVRAAVWPADLAAGAP